MGYVKDRKKLAIALAKENQRARDAVKTDKKERQNKIVFWRNAWMTALEKNLPEDYDGKPWELRGRARKCFTRYTDSAFRL
jgi:hypothetical protein